MTQHLTQRLKQTFGFDDFREGQLPAITQLLAGESTLAIFPTGSGKSLCYQFSALELPHVTLVVSPLLALIKDQIDFLKSKGISAESIDSSLTPVQNQAVMQSVREGHVKILMVSVERFKNERFRHFIQSINVSMLVVDEAHCISEWGHNFRPDYLKLPQYRRELNIPLTLLLTATATAQVKQDMANKFDIAPQHIVQTGFYRKNLNLSVLPVLSQDKNSLLLEKVREQQGAGIVYVTLQQSAEEVAQFLQSNGINAQAYHAGFESERRNQIQQDFMSGKSDVIVATIAFGMGIDKASIRFVIHYDLPKSIENYSQEIGRAGRDGKPANCITLANLDGVITLENFVYGDTPELSGIEKVLATIKNEVVAIQPNAKSYALQAMPQYQWDLQGLSLSTASNIKQLPLKTLLVQLELNQVLKPLFSYFAEFKYKTAIPEHEIVARFPGERGEFLNAVFSTSQKKKVWAEPNFELLFSQYNCTRERVVTALEYLAEQQLITLETKKITDVYQVNVDALSNENLARELAQYFQEKESSEIARINALIAFFQHDGCLSSYLAHYFDDASAPTRCGHCSVCLGNIAKLSRSFVASWPSAQVLKHAIDAFVQFTEQNNRVNYSTALCTKFLAGLTVPAFNRTKVKTLQGFGLCAQHRFEDIRQKIQ